MHFTKFNKVLSLFLCHVIIASVSAGLNGQVDSSYLQKSNLSRSEKDNYPLALIKLMTRYAKDLIWANKITKAEAVFTFTLTLTEGRSDASELRDGKFFNSTTIDPYV